jgi:hypothetical protein
VQWSGGCQVVAKEINAVNMHQVRIAQPAQHGWGDGVTARPAPPHTPDLNPTVSVEGGQLPAAPIIEDAVKRDHRDAVTGIQLMAGELFDVILEPANPRMELANDMNDVEGALFCHETSNCRSPNARATAIILKKKGPFRAACLALNRCGCELVSL